MMQKRLKSLRIEKGMTQQDVAEEVGISREYYCTIENLHNTPSISLIENILHALGYRLNVERI